MRRTNARYQPSEHLVGARVPHQLHARLFVGSIAAALTIWAALNHFMPDREPNTCVAPAHHAKR